MDIFWSLLAHFPSENRFSHSFLAFEHLIGGANGEGWGKRFEVGPGQHSVVSDELLSAQAQRQDRQGHC